MKTTATSCVVVHDAASKTWLQFENPSQVFSAYSLEQVVPCLDKIAETVEQNSCYAAGFISYEAAPAFDSALEAKQPDDFPLLWFGIYQTKSTICLNPDWLSLRTNPLLWKPSISREDYGKAIKVVKDHLAHGESYQVNYTYRMRASFHENPWLLFLQLIGAQEADYGAYLDIGRYVVCSASPELFFTRNNTQLTSSPMKGTAPRGRTLQEDSQVAKNLTSSKKNRAENMMIVDMIRNDLARVSKPGTITATKLFELKRYPTLWQMVSTVKSWSNASLCDILAALFPCASITGAPKNSTMQIIYNLETTPRHVYTGCIGYLAPNRIAQFSVAIRTTVLDKENNSAEFGVGGGIVWDSETKDEYEECQTKMCFLIKERPTFALLETLLWTPDKGFFLLGHHLKRLINTAEYFGFSVNPKVIKERLFAVATSLPHCSHRVRLLVSRDSTTKTEIFVLNPATTDFYARVKLANSPVDTSDVFLFHKTTNRRVYDKHLASKDGCDDVLLWNQHGEITESCFANIVAEMNGKLLTPPLASGLLAGTYRKLLLEQGEISERIITLNDLKHCNKLFLINSVRKWQKVKLLTTDTLPVMPASKRILSHSEQSAIY